MPGFIICFLAVLSFLAPETAFSHQRQAGFFQNSGDMQVENTLSKLSLKAKIGQLFLAPVYGTEQLDPEVLQFLGKTLLGNVICFRWANGLNEFAKVQRLTRQFCSEIRKNTSVLPLIAVDQEGGRIQRLKGRGFSDFPGHRALASFERGLPLGFLQALEKTKQTAEKIGSEMRAVGINLNLAPVVDVAPPMPKDCCSVIGSRSFSRDPEIVACFAEAFMTGLRKAKIASALKHFPGHGSATEDSHTGFSKITKNLSDLQNDLYPFSCLAHKTDLIMTAHVKVDSLDPDHIATFSEKILGSILRKKMGFQGIVISDSLVMRAAASGQRDFDEAVQSVSKAAIDAFLAGCDLLVLSSLEWADFTITPQLDMKLVSSVMENFYRAVLNGTIPRMRIDASLQRILTLKKRLED